MTTRKSSPRRLATTCLNLAALAGLWSCSPGDSGVATSERSLPGVRALVGDTTPPSVSITAPSSGDVIRDVANIAVTASDDGGPVVMAQLLVNGVPYGTDTQEPFAFTWDGRVLPEGPYELKVLAVDGAGNLGVGSPVTVTLVHGLVTFNAPAVVLGGTALSASLQISGPVPPGATMTFSSSPAGAFPNLPSAVSINSNTVAMSFSSAVQSAETAATITAAYQGSTKTVTIRLLPPSTPGLRLFSVPPTVVGGASTTGTIRLQSAVGAEVIVALASDNPVVAPPTTVAIPANTTQVTFPITTSAVGIENTATLTAAIGSGPTWTGTITVLPSTPRPASLTATPNPIAVGQTGLGTVTLGAPAPTGGTVVALAVSNPDTGTPGVQVPLTVTIPAGASTATFPIVATAWGSFTTNAITASLNGGTATLYPMQVARTLFEGNAVYDPGLRAPRCSGAGASCDTGNLVESRSAYFRLLPESNAPNTISNSCFDGQFGFPFQTGAYHRDSSLDRMRVFTSDGSALAPGKSVIIEVTTWSSGRLDLWSAPDANNPIWTLISSQRVTSPGITVPGPVTVTVPFVLPAGTLQTLRGNFGEPFNNAAPVPCPDDRDNIYGESDDLVFATGGGPLPNQAPKADAGPDQTTVLPPVVILVGKASDDGLPTPAAFTTTWTKVSGPGAVTFSDAAAPTTAATFAIAGAYVLQLTASDGDLTTTDTVTVNVNTAGAANVAPTVNAGPDQVVALPGGTTLAGTAVDDGKPNPPGVLSLSWSQLDGPGTAAIADPTAPATTVSFPGPGTYTFRLSATDALLTASDDVVVTVEPIANMAPVVDAGPDSTVTLPAAAPLAGSVSDDGLPEPHVVTAAWSKVSGPGTVTFANAALASTTATFSAVGTYVLRLQASDGALTASDTVTVVASRAIGLKVQYRAVSPVPGDNQIRAGLNIVNLGQASVPLRELKIRYWYTVDTNRPQTIECEFAAIGCSRITGSIANVSPARPGADRYVEVGFTSNAGNLAAGAQTGEIRGRIRKNDLSVYNESNDHSYAASAGAAPPTTLSDWTRVTLYRNGTRIWGTEP